MISLGEGVSPIPFITCFDNRKCLGSSKLLLILLWYGKQLATAILKLHV